MTSDDDLRARIAELEAENDRLRADATATRDLSDEVGAAPARPKRRRWRTVVASLLVILGLLLAPVAVVSAWARAELVDTDRFVATFGPLAEDPDVQAFVADQVTTVIEEQVDIPQLTSDVFDGIRALDLPPRAEDALGLLEAPAAQGLSSLVGSTVDRVIASDAFAAVWRQALTVSHQQLTAALQGDPEAALEIGGDGTLSVQLGPIVEAVKQRLLDQGVGFASAIPAVDLSVQVVQADSLVLVQTIYALAVAVGAWLPWVVLVLLAAGVLVAKRRSVALAWTGAGLAAIMLLTLAGFGTGRLFFVGTVSPSIMTAGAAEALFSGLTQLMVSTIGALAILAVAVAVIAWMSGSSAPAQRVRGFADAGFGTVRRNAAGHGISTGRFGEQLDRWRVAAYVGIAVAASLVLLASRPLTGSTVIWTVVLALLAVLLVQLLRRPAGRRRRPAAMPPRPALRRRRRFIPSRQHALRAEPARPG
ncbi:hypothetical protein GCM10025870_26680 [Agromyces marinus]|uniref:Integral membrane protein n=2 Tax=Agromyces marinus TaxID=1389020 RepID=A0ABM8H4D2_9MICO|nr:hypothetical protein GCM10025870_26680 [Agromyces marinus]